VEELPKDLYIDTCKRVFEAHFFYATWSERSEVRDFINLYSLRLMEQVCRINLFRWYFGTCFVGSAPEMQEDTKMGYFSRIIFRISNLHLRNRKLFYKCFLAESGLCM